MTTSIEQKSSTGRSKLASAFAKVFHVRSLSGTIPVKGSVKSKLNDKIKDGSRICHSASLFDDDDAEKFQKKAAMKAFIAKVFASISSIKAAYAELQIAQSPYDADGIQSSDETLVSELKNLSQLKQSFLKKQFDHSPGTMLLESDIQELKSRLKIFEITGRKLETEVKLKDSEITFLREKLEECVSENRIIEKKLYSSGALSNLNLLHLPGLTPRQFSNVLACSLRSIRRFVRMMVREMEYSFWDLDAAARAIDPEPSRNPNYRLFAFESFVSREIFHEYQNFSSSGGDRKSLFSDFMELKSVETMEFLLANRKGEFAEFCRRKYLQVVHPRMELSFFGNLNQREALKSGGFPATEFFSAFAEMARRVWLLHLLGLCFQPEAAIFQARKGCRFSEVFMESVVEESDGCAEQCEQRVAFTVVPGFRVGQTVIQCRVYLSQV